MRVRTRKSDVLSSAPVRLLTGVAIVCGALALFAEISDDQAEEDGRAFDRQMLETLRGDGSPAQAAGPRWLPKLAEAISSLGSTGVVAITTIATAWFVRNRSGGSKQAAWVVAAFVGSLVGSLALKKMYDRGRPPRHYHMVESKYASFPSGHALLSTVTYMTLAAVVARGLKRQHEKLAALFVGIAAAGLTGASRVYLGVHWAGDVMAGWALGAAAAAGSFMLNGNAHKRPHITRDMTHINIGR